MRSMTHSHDPTIGSTRTRKRKSGKMFSGNDPADGYILGDETPFTTVDGAAA